MGPLTRIAGQHRLDRRKRELRTAAEPVARELAREYAARLPRVPALAPIPQPDPWGANERGEHWRTVNLSDRECPRCGAQVSGLPTHRVVAVPLIPSPVLARTLRPETIPIGTGRYQSVEYRLDHKELGGGTRVTWWSWEPCAGSTTPEVRHRLSRAAAYANRVRECLSMLIGPIGTIERRGIHPRIPVATNDLWEWTEQVIEDVEQALGLP